MADFPGPGFPKINMLGLVQHTVVEHPAVRVGVEAAAAEQVDAHLRPCRREPRCANTCVGTVALAITKLREGSYFPAWLLERRKRAERALVSVVATSYLLGVGRCEAGAASHNELRRCQPGHLPHRQPAAKLGLDFKFCGSALAAQLQAGSSPHSRSQRPSFVRECLADDLGHV